MKKSTKVLLFGGLILFGAGTALVVTVSAICGTAKIAKMAANGDFSIEAEGHGRLGLFNIDGITYSLINEHADYDDEDGYIHKGYIDHAQIASKDQVKNLDISFGGGVLRVEKSSDDNVYITVNHEDEFRYGVGDEETLFIEQKDAEIIHGNGEIILFLPEGLKFDRVNIDFGGGKLEVDEIYAEELNASVGAGQIDVARITAYDASFDVGAGDLDIENGVIENLNLDVAVGKADYEGSISGSCDVNCDIGKVNLELNNKEEEFNYDVDCALGKVSIGSNWSSGTTVERRIDNGKDKNISVDCATGKVDIDFK